VRWTVRSIGAIAAGVTDQHADAVVEAGPGIACLLAPGRDGVECRRRVLRHLEHLDEEGVAGPARPLRVPVASPGR
jgi:hypothetical protein